MRLGDMSLFGTMRARKAGRKMSRAFVVLFLTFVFAFSFIYVLKTIVPTFTRIAENEAKVIATFTTNRAVEEIFENIDLSYTDLFTLEKNDDGKVIAMTSDMINVNRIKSKVAIRVLEKLSEKDMAKMSVPLGTLLGSDVFAGTGPIIDFELMPVGASIVDVFSEFTDSGINQTHLKVFLKVNTDIALLMPGFRRMTKVSSEVPVIDTVIVGDVPSSYVNVDREGYEFEDDVLQLAED